MITLRVEVPAHRERTAIATLRDEDKILGISDAVASASPTVAAKNGNPGCDPLRLWGHAPLGTYRILTHAPAQSNCRDEYGTHLLLFEPVSGAALEAESFGRLGLLVYGGAPANDGHMRRTQGGVRLSDAMLAMIMERLQPGTQVSLELMALRPAAWWAFWKPAAPTQPLSADTVGPLAAPIDELSLMHALLQAAPQRPKLRNTRDESRDHDYRTDDRSSPSEADQIRGGGGQFGGAGATGRWDAAGGTAGVDQAGRIITGAAAGAALAGLAAAAAQANPGETADHGTGHSNGFVGDSGGANSGAADPASPVGATTSTAY